MAETTRMTLSEVRSGATSFGRGEDRLWLSLLCGMTVGRQGEDTGPTQTQGIALLQIDGRRYEAGGLALTNTGLAPVRLSRCLARMAFLPGPYECDTQASRWCRENEGAWQRLHTGLRLSDLPGRPTEGSTPYLALRRVGADRGVAFHMM